MKAEKCACPLTAEADSLQRPVNGYRLSVERLRFGRQQRLHRLGQAVSNHAIHPGAALIMAVPVADVPVGFLFDLLIRRILFQGLVARFFDELFDLLGIRVSGLSFSCSLS